MISGNQKTIQTTDFANKVRDDFQHPYSDGAMLNWQKEKEYSWKQQHVL